MKFFKTSILKFLLVLFVMIAQLVSAVSAQTKEPQNENEAERLFNAGRYREALPLFEKQLKRSPGTSKLNFFVGFCYFNSATDLTKSIPYFEKAAKDHASEFYYDTKFYLSQAYHLANRFDDAIASFESMKEGLAQNKSGNELRQDINRRIEMCNYGKTLFLHPRNVSIVNLGKVINSEYQDYAPIISADESVMIFTSRRKGSTGGLLDENGDYYEDIYSSKNENGRWEAPLKIDSLSAAVPYKKPKWAKAKRLGKAINTDKHDAAIGLSPDGQKLFIYRNEDVYESRLSGKDWGLPVKLNATINSKAKEPSASLSPDEKILYFVSDRKGGYGGKDIYKSEKLANGEWGPAQNLGPMINTIYDEEAPFIQADGKTLYFSSKGHVSMGGFDIFRTVFDGKWSSPENIGYPINTSGDDIYYVVAAKGDHAYFSSLRKNGLGAMDIYFLIFEGVSIPLTEVKGLVLAGDSLKPSGASIVVTDNATNKEVGTFTANSETGKYLLIFPPGKNYKLVITVPGFEPHTENVFIPDQKKYYQLYQEIHFKYAQSSAGKLIGQSVNLQNAFFDINKYIHSDSALFSAVDTAEVYSAYLKYMSKDHSKRLGNDSIVYSKKEVVDYYNPADGLAIAKVETKRDTILAPHKNTVSGGDTLAMMPTTKSPALRENATTKSGHFILYFKNNEHRVDTSMYAALDNLCQQLNQNTASKIKVKGHTDNIGNDAYNNLLALYRAESVRNYLVKKGIAFKRIAVHSYGKWWPLALNTSEEGRKRNRRAEIIVY
jgi:outer membrane protein OmpA-like peptidoglycan-associated protein/tetratricopeptide (TPR) repeat protein